MSHKDIYRVYVGTRASDISSYDAFFSEIIAYYGAEQENCAAYSKGKRVYTDYSPAFIDFVIHHMNRIISSNPDCKFYFYASKVANKVLERNGDLIKYFVCLNSGEVIHRLDDKLEARKLLGDIVPMPSHTMLSKDECRIDLLNRRFGGDQFVIQNSDSSGGEETYLFYSGNEQEIRDLLKENGMYMVSKFYENAASVSCHIMVFDNDIVVFKPGIQLSFDTAQTGWRFIHNGNDYIAGKKNLTNAVKNDAYKYSKAIGQRIKELGYRGICGIDYLLADGNLLFLEMNPRFLASSFLIEQALRDSGLLSLWELNISAFHQQAIEYDDAAKYENMDIPYRSFTVSYYADLPEHKLTEYLELCKNTGTVFMDGYTIGQDCEKDVYLFRSIHKDTQPAS